MEKYAFKTGDAVEEFLRNSQKNWQAAVNHRFIQELFEGTIEDEVLKKYLIQDYHFFDAFLSMLGACVAHVDTDEDGYFQKAFKELGVTEKEFLEVTLHSVTKEFQKLMYSAVDSSDYAQLLVMLVIAEGLYLDWGSKELPLSKKYIHLEWIHLHRGEFFKEWVQFLVDELNRVCKDKGTVSALHERWNQAVALELAFFEIGYEA